MNLNNLNYLRLKLILLGGARLILMILFSWTAIMLTPIGSPNALPEARTAIWLLFASMILAVSLIGYEYYRWGRRQLLIFQITKLIHDRTGGGSSLPLEGNNGDTAYISAYRGSISLVVDKGFETINYTIMSGSIYGLKLIDNVALDPSNIDTGVLKYITDTERTLMPMTERELELSFKKFITRFKENN